jgi:hypothetical protein
LSEICEQLRLMRFIQVLFSSTHVSFDTINKRKLFSECVIPRPQDAEHVCLCYCIFLNPFIISIAVLENVPPDTGLQKRTTFSTLKVGLSGCIIEPGPPAWQAAALTAQPSTTPLIKVLPVM